MHRPSHGSLTLKMSATGNVDCDPRSLLLQIDERMQGDGLHPTPEGLSVLASCILSTVQGIIGPGTLDTYNAHPLRQWIGQKRAAGQIWDG